MTVGRSRLPSRCRIIALSGTILSVAVLAPAAQAAGAPAITVGEPEGFAELTKEQTLLIDIFLGGTRRGEAKIVVSPGAVTFLEPSVVVELLPPLTDRDAVEAALAAEQLPAHSELVCSQGSDRTRCGRLTPDVAGLIYDRERFRIDIFLNPRLLAIRDDVQERYLPPAEGGPSMINSIGATYSGQTGSGRAHYSLYDQLILAQGDRRIRADLSYASGLGFQAERLALEWDRPELRYSAGALWTPGSEIWGQRKLIGAGVQSQVDTRRDRDEIIGSPVIVYLDQRARVDLLRDGRVLSSAIHGAGNQQIDTANLPEGSYEIVLRIDEPGRPAREERRLFTKSRRIPSKGRTDFLAIGGLLVEGAERGSLNPSPHPYFQGSASRRMSEALALDANVQLSNGHTAAQIGATLLTPLAILRTAAIADVAGTHGGIVQLISSGSSRLNFNLELRRIEVRDVDGPTVAPEPLRSSSPFARGFDRPVTSYSQAAAVISYSVPDFRVLGVFSYRNDEDQVRARYSIGPSLEWDVLRIGALKFSLRGDAAITEAGESGFAGISVRFLGGRSTLSSLVGYRSSSLANDDLGEGAVAALSGTWGTQAAGGDLALGAGFEHQPRQDSVILSSDFRHPLASFAGDLVRSDGPGLAVSQYSLGLQTTVVAGGGKVEVAGRTTADSVIVVQVAGARALDTFDVLVNEQVAGRLRGQEALNIPVPSYRSYDMRIRATGADLLAYDSSVRNIAVYPGTVTKVEWEASPITVKFGRLVAPDGSPIRGASITGKGVWSETDEEGMFQIEVADDIELLITLKNGRSYTTRLPGAEGDRAIAHLGTVVCCIANVELGALDPSRLN